MSNTDSSDEEYVVAYYYFRRKQEKSFCVTPYLEKRIRCRLFVVAWKLAIAKHWVFLSFSHKFNVYKLFTHHGELK
jgi:hypothetical protein